MFGPVRRLFAPEGRELLVALIVAGALFMELLDGTVIATALPQMAVSFHENPVNLSIGISAFLITLAIFIPASGWMADRFGSKTVFGSAIVIFTVASVLCGSSNTLWEFTAARVLQGLGGAMMVPVGRLVVLRSSDKRDLIRNTQFITTPGLIAPVLGPPLGGFITTFANWRWIFYLNVPIGIAGLVLVALYMTNQRAAEHQRFDWLGFALCGTGLAALIFGLDQFGRPNVDFVAASTLTGGGLVVCALAVLHLRRDPYPLLDLSLFRIPTFSSATLVAGSCFRIVIGSTPFLWPLLFQVGFGMSAFLSGLVIVSCAVGDLAMKVYTVRIMRRFGFRRTLFVNGILASIAVLACALFTRSTPIVVIVAVLFVIGLSRSVQFGSFNALAYADIAPQQMSAATSLGMTIQQISFGIGIAFGAVVLHGAAALRGEGAGTLAIADFQIAFVAVALIAFVSALSFGRLDPYAGAHVSGHRPDAGRAPAPAVARTP
jgi:EmrB/QacA subfamily drug resistance transporter